MSNTGRVSTGADWEAAAVRNHQLKTAMYHLGKAAGALEHARNRLHDAGEDTSRITTALANIRGEADHIAAERNKLFTKYVLEY